MQLLRSVIPEHPDHEDLRGPEWFHLWREHRGEDARLRGHAGAVTAVAFSPDGLRLASAGADGTVRVWDLAAGGRAVVLRGHSGKVAGVAFAPDSRRLASAGVDRTLRVWDAAGRSDPRTVRLPDPASAVAFSPDGRWLVCGAGKTARVFDAGTGAPGPAYQLKVPVAGCAVSPDGRRVAAVGYVGEAVGAKGEAVVWDPVTGEAVATLPGDHGRTDAAFSPDGTRLAVGEVVNDKTNEVKVWEVGTGRCVATLRGHAHVVTRLAYHPGGGRLATASNDHTVRVWDAGTGALLHTLHEEAAVAGVAFSPDGSRLASACEDRTIKVWSPPAGAVRTIDVGGAKAVAGLAFSPDGSRLAVSAVRAAVFDVATGRQVLALPGKADTYGRIAWGGGEKYLGVGTRLELWHAATGSPARPPLEPPDGGPDPHRPSSTGMRGVGASFGPDGRYFAATLGQQEGVAVWEVATGRVLRQIAREDRTVYFSGLAFHPDGVRLAVGTAKQGWTPPGTVTEWDVATGAKVRTYEAARDGVTCVAYSPGGEYLAASTGRPRAVTSVPGQVRVWDTATGEEVFTLDGHRTAVWSVAFNRDGSRLASAGNTYMSTVADRGEMVIWDLRTGLPVFRYDGRAKDANAVAFSPCGRYLACAYTEGRVRVYDATPLAETPAYQPLPDDH